MRARHPNPNKPLKTAGGQIETNRQLKTEFRVPSWMDPEHPQSLSGRKHFGLGASDDDDVDNAQDGEGGPQNEPEFDDGDQNSNSDLDPIVFNDMDGTLIPNRSNYDAYRYFQARGEFAALEPADDSGDTYVAPLSGTTYEVFSALEHQKQLASIRMAEMIGGYNERVESEKFREAEYGITRRRVELLAKCITAPRHDVLYHVFDKPPPDQQRVSVQYRKFYSKDHTNTHELQSPVSWVVPMEWGFLLGLTSELQKECTSQAHHLLKGVMTGCPKRESTMDLVRQMELNSKSIFESANNLHALSGDLLEAPRSSTTIGWKYRKVPANELDSTITISTGVLLVNVCELWHNQNTNKLVQEALSRSGAQSLRDNISRGPTHTQHNNVIRVHITIFDPVLQVNHVLSLAPFFSPDACIVSFMQFVQNIADPSDDQADKESYGILKIIPNTESVTPDTIGRVMPDTDIEHKKTEIIGCVGAHRNIRLNEHHLADVHASSILDFNDDNDNALDAWANVNPDDLDFDKEEMPAAKVARISLDEWDILVSSCQTDTKVYTYITTVNYPPFGTQFESRLALADAEWPRHHAGRHHHKVPRPPGLRHDPWFREMEPKEMYFVVGVAGKVTDKKARLTFYEPNSENRHSTVYQLAMINLRDKFLRDYHDQWVPELRFFGNIEKNENINPTTGHTIKEEWVQFWREIIRKDIMAWDTAMPDNLEEWPGYWYCETPAAWRRILGDDALGDKYARLSKDLHDRQVAQKIHLKSNQTTEIRKDPSIITMPVRGPAAVRKISQTTKPPEITQMQARIQALEAKLDRSRQEANNAHLLQEVLSKLDRPSALRY